MPRLALILILTLALLPAACGTIPDFRAGSPAPRSAGPAAPSPATPSPPLEMTPLPGAGVSAGAAEAACTAAGVERGFQVQGIVGSTDVAGTDGQPASRDVMMRVARGTQVFDLRCSYHYASAQARVMAL
jgi:hypothetical protein